MTKRCISSLVLGCTVISGCYTYHPVGRRDVALNQEVQVRVTEAGTERVTRMLGEAPDFEAFRGRVEAGPSPDSLYLSVSPARVGASSTRSALRVLIPFPESEIEEIGAYRLNRGKTLVVVGVSAVAATVLVKTLFDTELGKKGSDSSGGPDQALIPFLQIRW